MDRRFTALRVIGTILKVLAWIALIFGLLAAIGSLVLGFTLNNQLGISGLDVGGPLAGIALFVVILVIAILQFLFLYAAGEFLYLFLSIEENSRRTAFFLQQQYTLQQGGYVAPPPMPDYDD
jgi:lipopolysaccharide export LptBFGC system permease protein LptF